MTDSTDQDQEVILGRIVAAEARIVELDAQRAAACQELQALHAALHAFPVHAPRSLSPRTSDEKVALFRSLFRGRTDVFPRLWSNPRTNGRATPRHVLTSGFAASARSRG